MKRVVVRVYAGDAKTKGNPIAESTGFLGSSLSTPGSSNVDWTTGSTALTATPGNGANPGTPSTTNGIGAPTGTSGTNPGVPVPQTTTTPPITTPNQ